MDFQLGKSVNVSLTSWVHPIDVKVIIIWITWKTISNISCSISSATIKHKLTINWCKHISIRQKQIKLILSDFLNYRIFGLISIHNQLPRNPLDHFHLRFAFLRRQHLLIILLLCWWKWLNTIRCARWKNHVIIGVLYLYILVFYVGWTVESIFAKLCLLLLIKVVFGFFGGWLDCILDVAAFSRNQIIFTLSHRTINFITILNLQIVNFSLIITIYRLRISFLLLRILNSNNFLILLIWIGFIYISVTSKVLRPILNISLSKCFT